MADWGKSVNSRLRYATYFGYAVSLGLMTLTMIAVVFCKDMVNSFGSRVLLFIAFYCLPFLVFFVASLAMRWLFVRVGLMTRVEAKQFPLRRDSQWPPEWQGEREK